MRTLEIVACSLAGGAVAAVRVFGPGAKLQHALPPLLYLGVLMAVVPLVVYLPTHLVLVRAFRPPQTSAT